MSNCTEHGSEWMELVSMSPDGSGCDEICWLCYTFGQLNDTGQKVLTEHVRRVKEQAWDAAEHHWKIESDTDNNPYRSEQ